jgi:hypothetical protein
MVYFIAEGKCRTLIKKPQNIVIINITFRAVSG